MKKYVAILRGINVSGQKLIKMAELKAHVEDLGLRNVITYIQSGNVIFDSDETNSETLSALIANKIKEVYGWDVPVIIRTKDEISEIINNNPFGQINQLTDKWYVTFLTQIPNNQLAHAFAEIKFGPDEFILILTIDPSFNGTFASTIPLSLSSLIFSQVF